MSKPKVDGWRPSQHAPDARLAAIAPTSRHSAVEEVMARLGLAVDLGLLAPDERLPHQDSLAATFNVSPTTVRRALTQLCKLGVLERRRGRLGGTFVATVPPRQVLSQFGYYREASDEVIGLLDHRLVLECGIVVLAADRRTADDIRRLRAQVKAMDEVDSWSAFRAIDPRFHLQMASVAGSSSAAEALTDLLSRLYRYYVPYPLEYLRASNGEHREMVDAIAARDALAAVDAVERHLSEVYMTMVPRPRPAAPRSTRKVTA
jgi:DNA-binding FadR family transcriptional regulator